MNNIEQLKNDLIIVKNSCKEGCGMSTIGISIANFYKYYVGKKNE